MLGVNRRGLWVGLVLLVASVLAYVMTPRNFIADQGSKIDLESMIPTTFGDWAVDTTVVPVTLSADVKERLDKIYNQTLERTYVNRLGDRVMLSIAYGSDQSDAMQVHKPEVCYPSQGFEVTRHVKETLDVNGKRIPVHRLIAVLGARVEPITYWITVGNEIAKSGVDRKLAQLRYGLYGSVPDGLLFRMSSISSDPDGAFEVQRKFARDLVATLGQPEAERLIGR